MKFIQYILLLLAIALLADCSDDQADKAAIPETGQSETGQMKTGEFKPPLHQADRNAEMEEVLRQTRIYAQQEEEKRQKQIESRERKLIIGVVGPETGEQSRYGMSVVNGVLAAAKRFNAEGGIDGKAIKVLHYNNESSMAKASNIVSYLIDQGAVAVLSSPTGASTFTPIHLINESKTIFVSIGSRRHIERSGEYVFRTAIPDETATLDLIQYATTELGYVNYALVTSSNHDFSLDLSSMFKQAVYKSHGAIKVEADVYDTYTGSTNIDLVIDAIKNSAEPLQGVIFTGSASEGILLAKGLKKAGLKLPIIGGEDLDSQAYLEAGNAVEGTLLYSTLAPDAQSSKMAEFIKDYGTSKPDRFSALAYDTFMLIADAIKTAGSTNTGKVREAMINRKECMGITGNTRFSREGAPIKHPLLCKIKKGKHGERVVVLKQ
ncbi:MAG: ABC transporter substrate-binding protein [Mariprofundus sp.]|nr:ABC transporter substrate-binding protein [Mariprofundus sp.]